MFLKYTRLLQNEATQEDFLEWVITSYVDSFL